MIDVEKVRKADRDYPYSIWRIRVPGGWIYHFDHSATVFVPIGDVVQDEALASAKFEKPKANFTPL